MRRDERGLAVSVEAAVVLPAIVLFLGLLLTLGRVVLAEQHVGAAASAGARAASLERTVGQARSAADSAVGSAWRSGTWPAGRRRSRPGWREWPGRSAPTRP